MSGLNQQFTKLSNLNWFREFESRSLRSKKKVSVDSLTLKGVFELQSKHMERVVKSPKTP